MIDDSSLKVFKDEGVVIISYSLHLFQQN